MKYRNRVLGLLFLLSIITYMDRVCIGLAGKRIQADLGLNESQLGWVLGIFALSYAVFEIPSGAMGDRIGPRKVLTRIQGSSLRSRPWRAMKLPSEYGLLDPPILKFERPTPPRQARTTPVGSFGCGRKTRWSVLGCRMPHL